MSAQPGPGTQEVLGSKYPPCLTPTRSGEQAGGFASLRGLPAAGRGRGRPAAPPPSHHVTSKGRAARGLECGDLSVARRARRAAAEGGKRQGPRPRLGGLAGWGWGAGGGPFPPNARAGGMRHGGRRLGFVQETCKYGPRNSICSCRFPI